MKIRKEGFHMLTVTNKAVAALKAAKAAQGAPPDAGIRIVQGAITDDIGKPTLAVGFAISDDPAPNDEELEQNGLRIFVEDALVEPLDGRTLDVGDADEGPEFVFR
jgi:Fe-S cluster assembly iron-binding protein IscA